LLRATLGAGEPETSGIAASCEPELAVAGKDMTNSDQFHDWRAICELKARYCRLMDTKDWEGWRELFSEDYELDVSQESGVAPIRGREAALDWVLSHIRGATTAHQVHTPEIKINGDEAEGVWAMQDRLVFGPQGPSITGFGHYHERYVRLAGQWKIARLRLTRLHVDAQPQPAAPSRAD
jgi:SnoaL-like domain